MKTLSLALLLAFPSAHAGSLAASRQKAPAITAALKNKGAVSISYNYIVNEPGNVLIGWKDPASGAIVLTGYPDLTALRSELKAIAARVKAKTDTTTDLRRAVEILLTLQALD